MSFVLLCLINKGVSSVNESPTIGSYPILVKCEIISRNIIRPVQVVSSAQIKSE